MQNVFVIGGAMIAMGKYPASSYSNLAIPAVLNALADASVTREQIGAVYCGHAFGGMLTGQRIIKEIGLGGIPVINIDNACSGGASALNQAYHGVKQGRHDAALVIGVDKLTQFGSGTLPLCADDAEVRQGMTMPALYAMRARRYLYERDAEVADLARVSVKARRHSARNPYAQYRNPVTIEEVLSSRPIADPLTLLQCCPTGDGASAVVIASGSFSKRIGRPSMRIAASALHSGQVTDGFRNMLRPDITFDCAGEAYREAAIGPEDLDVVELHDAFTIAELLYYEALGLCAVGDSLGFLKSGATTYGGKVVVNPSGGLLSKGHPVGASGVAQVVEMFWQLTNQAGSRQVADARVGLTHVTGGGISGLDHGACAVHIFEAHVN
jgi:benzoylsuccinyl-CoA thiolase BbsB subunit